MVNLLLLSYMWKDGVKCKLNLDENLLETAKDLRQEGSFTFHQENDAKHTARATMK